MAHDDESDGLTDPRALLVAAYRRAHAAPPSRSDRVLARLRRVGDELSIVATAERPLRFAGGSNARATSSTLPASTRSLLWVAVFAIAAALLAVLALEALTGRLAHRVGERRHDAAVDGAQPRDAVQGGIVDRRAPAQRRGASQGGGPTIPPAPGEAAALEPLPAELPPTPAAAPVVQRPTVGPPLVRVPQPVPPRQTTRAAPSSVAAATAEAAVAEDPGEVLLVRARKAMDRGDWVAAAEALEQHAREFPDSPRAHAREAFRIVVDCRRSPGPEVRARARDFIVQQARSPHVRRILAACRATAGAVSPFDGPSDAIEGPVAPSTDAPAP
jgi:hypothetical protein